MQVQQINNYNYNNPSFGIKKYNVLSTATKPAKQPTFEQRNELRKYMEKFVREANVRYHKARKSIERFFKGALM